MHRCILLLAFISLARATSYFPPPGGVTSFPTQCQCPPGTRSGNALVCFPFCNCQDYSPSSSPWLLRVVALTESAGEVSVTFQFTNVTAPATPSPCFRNFSARGIQKVQVNTFTTCNNDNTDIFIGNTLCTTSGCKVETPASYPNQRYFRIGSFSAQQAYAGTTITIVGRGACGTLATLLKAPAGQIFSYTIYKEFASNFICCPSGCGDFFNPPPPPEPLAPLPPISETLPPPPRPPPPAPPTPFPHQNCKPGNGAGLNGGIKGVPFNIDIRKVQTYPGATGTGERYCWVVNPHTCRTASGCCEISLDKIEVAVKEGCRNSATVLRNIYAFGGKGTVALSSSTAFVPGTANTPSPTSDVIKFTAIKYQGARPSLATIKSLATAGQNTICFTIDSTRTCGTGAKLFLQPAGLRNGVQYAYWGFKPSSSTQCCGTEFTPFTGSFTG